MKIIQTLEKYHFLMVWNGIQDIHGHRVDHSGAEWDFALEWKQVFKNFQQNSL